MRFLARSFTFKLILPIVAATTVGLSSLILLEGAETRRETEVAMRQRAHEIFGVLEATANISDLQQLQRMTTVVASDRDIVSLTLTTTDEAIVLTSSELVWIGQPLASVRPALAELDVPATGNIVALGDIAQAASHLITDKTLDDGTPSENMQAWLELRSESETHLYDWEHIGVTTGSVLLSLAVALMTIRVVVTRRLNLMSAGIEASRHGPVPAELAEMGADSLGDVARTLYTTIKAHEESEAELIRSRDELANRDEWRTQFLSGVAHELRTPLTVVSGNAELLLDGEITADDAHESLAEIAFNSWELTNLVEDLLILGRMDSSTINLNIHSISARHHVEASVHQARHYHPDREILVEGDPTVRALADSHRFRQIIRNLLTNAFRYGGPGLGIRISANDDIVHVDVIDDGEGVADGEDEAIFHAFRSGAGINIRPEPVGLGLSLCRTLATLMDGTLTYQRRDGYTIFRLTLPRGEDAD